MANTIFDTDFQPDDEVLLYEGSRFHWSGMEKVNGRERYEVRGIRHTRFPWQLRAAGAAVGFIGLCWVIEYVLIPAVLWAVLALFGEVPA